MSDFEKLGAFYLGRLYDLDSGTVTDEPLLYDAKDLTTHAVCVGMTGSGKTGLGISLLEEAAIDGIPTIAIDPKGDLGNVLLTFPELRAEDFRPWIDQSEAARKGRTPDEQARWTAELWRSGLAEWGQDGARVARFRDAVDATIYTPGSTAGRPLAVLRSLAAPTEAVGADPEALRERIQGAVSGLLGLLGIDADPLRSREHILLATILDRHWREGRDMDLAGLIREIQKPPVDRVGVMDLDSFFPPADRFELAMTLNNLLASPGFAVWSEGEPLDIGRLLYTSDGKPRLSVLSIAHLSEAERMFFVTLLLNEVLAWMRTRPGARSLRALLYMDEVFGYFPPTANPPSKRPMLTLLKQARAYGLGVVLATQNPVDLDYKGLSNAGTWFLGRLQTERDKLRVLEGLEGASAAAGSSFDRGRMERILAGLRSRVFLMNNVHEDEPVVFQTRWALSYLGGPLTREQIRTLDADRAAAATAADLAAGGSARVTSASSAAPEAAEPASITRVAGERPVVPPEVSECFLTVSVPGDGQLVYRPALLAAATLHYVDSRAKVDTWRRVCLLAALDDATVASPWDGGITRLGRSLPPLEDSPSASASFAKLPSDAARAASYARWKKMLATHLYRQCPLTLWRCAELRATSEPGESQAEFRARLRELVREKRDLEIEKLRTRYAPKLARLQDQIRRAGGRIEREQAQYQQQKLQTAISFGSTVLGALFGRKLRSAGTVGSATTAMRGAGRAAREREDVERAVEESVVLERRLADLQAEFERETDRLRDELHGDAFELTETAVAPRKSDLAVDQLVLAWTPWLVPGDGVVRPAYRSGASDESAAAG